MAAAITSCTFKFAREKLAQNLQKNPQQRTFYATLESKDKDFRTFVILDQLCDDFEEMNPNLKYQENEIISAISKFEPLMLGNDSKHLYQKILLCLSQ